jgi:hypothetical protein
MKQFFKGWANFFLGLETKEAKRKSKICIKCKHIKKGKIEILKDNQIEEINGAYCNLCKCPLIAKLRSNDKCPKGKF